MLTTYQLKLYEWLRQVKSLATHISTAASSVHPIHVHHVTKTPDHELQHTREANPAKSDLLLISAWSIYAVIKINQLCSVDYCWHATDTISYMVWIQELAWPRQLAPYKASLHHLSASVQPDESFWQDELVEKSDVKPKQQRNTHSWAMSVTPATTKQLGCTYANSSDDTGCLGSKAATQVNDIQQKHTAQSGRCCKEYHASQSWQSLLGSKDLHHFEQLIR